MAGREDDLWLVVRRARLASAWLAVAWLLAPGAALAHTGVGVLGGFASGFEHPVFGYDHLLAMVAVGMWGAQLGSPLIWILPVTFPMVMAVSGMLAGFGMPLPGVEVGIAASVVVLGVLLALAARPPIWVAAVVVGAFAVSTATRTAPSCPRPPTRSPMAWAS